MAAINNTIKLTDRMTGPLHSINNALNSTLDALESMKGSMGESFDTSKINSARKSIESANASIVNLSGHIEEADTQQKHLNDSVNAGTSAVGKLVGAFAGMIGIKKLVGLSDTFSQTRARLDLINDGLQTTKELEDEIFKSAQRSRAMYQDTADIVSKLGATAGKSFSSNKEIIRFAELMNKNFIVGGSGSTEQASAMYQLTQAMSSGRLQGDEYRSIIENAPLLAKAIEDYMRNVQHAKGSMKDWASEGKLTAQVIKSALFSTADDINKKFESMPMTWGQVWTNICNRVYKASQPILQIINKIANNWEIIEPIVLSSAAAIGIYLLVTKGASAATAVWSSIQAGFNAIMAMNPIFIIIMAIVLLIGMIYAVVAAINKVTGKSISATGLICGSINVIIQFLWNLLLVAGNVGMGIWYVLCAVANNIGTAFSNGINLVKANLWGLLETATTVALKIANVLNKLPFVNIDVSGLASKAGSYAAKKAEALGNIKQMQSLESAYFKGSHTFNAFEEGWASKAFNNGAAFGQKINGTVGNMFNTGTNDLLNSINDGIDNIGNDTGSISKNMDITSEDLKYLRDIAEQDAINRFTTAEIKVDLGGVTNNVSNNIDLDGMISYVVDELSMAVEEVSRGVS